MQHIIICMQHIIICMQHIIIAKATKSSHGYKKQVHMATMEESLPSSSTCSHGYNGRNSMQHIIICMQHITIAEVKKSSHAYSGRIYMQHITIAEDKKSSHAYS